MNTSIHKVKILLILLLISVMPFTRAQGENEYLGIVVAEGMKDDKKYGSFPIGFDFEFFGVTHDVFWVSSNGLVMFGSGSNAFSNVSIPNGSRPDNFIAAFWDDLIIHSSGDIMYQTIGTAPNRKLVIQFNNMSFWTSTVLLGTIQVILYEGSNNIQMQYNSIVDVSSDRASGGEATVGLENSDGTAGVLCSYNTPGYIYSGRAILFTPNGGSYTFDDNALFENVILTDVIPRAGIPNLVSPTHNSSVEETVTFMWEAASHASSYFVLISQNADMSSPIHTSVDLTDLSYDYTLAPDQTFYWSANAKNSSGEISWSEIWSFKTSLSAQLLAVPQTIQLEQGELQIIPLLFTGGDGGSKTATISSLPGEGTLYQNNSGVPGTQITAVPTDVSDPFHSVIYSASGATGSGTGSFDFHFTDGTGSSSDESITVHVSPQGIPNFLYASKETDRVEITFDRAMADPSGFHLDFAIEDNGAAVTSSSCSLKTGDPNTIVVFVNPNLNTANDITVAYTRGSVTAASGGILESFDFQLAGKLAQTINFNALTDKTYGDADYPLSATASSGLPITFSSSNSAIASVSGSMAAISNAGEAYISAYQAGDATYTEATFKQLQVVNKGTATVVLSDLTQSYTGAGISATITTIPAGLNTHVTYNGSAILPVDPGSYSVWAEIVETNFMGSASALLTINDSDAPIPDLIPLPDLIDECSVTPLAPTATDLQSGQIVGITGTPFPVTTQGTTIITWTYDDGNGNISTQPQSIVINDVSDPQTPTLSDQLLDCSSPAIAPTTSDACVGTITGTTTDALSFPTSGLYVINWTFDDGNGNIILVSQNVIVSDMSDPVTPTLSDVTGECSATVSVPTTTDACAGNITGTTTDPLSYSIVGTYIITWTFDDGNGNSINATQNVFITDVTAPTATAPADAFTCDGIVSSIGLTNVNDNCSTPLVSYVLNGATTGSGSGDASAVLFEPGISTVTYTLDDGNGNTSQYVVTVTYEEVEQIVVSVDAGTLSCENSGSYQWISCADNSIIPGETASTFRPDISGEYAVILTQGSCSATSACYSLDYTATNDDIYQDYKVYPNPTRNYVNIDMGREHTNASIQVFDMTGNLLKIEELDRLSRIELDLSEFKAGLYMIHILSDQINSVSRVIKE